MTPQPSAPAFRLKASAPVIGSETPAPDEQEVSDTARGGLPLRSGAAASERRFRPLETTASERLGNSVVPRPTLLLDRRDAAVARGVAPRRPAMPTGTCGIENAAPPGEPAVTLQAPVRLLGHQGSGLQQAARRVEAEVPIVPDQPPARDELRKRRSPDRPLLDSPGDAEEASVSVASEEIRHLGRSAVHFWSHEPPDVSSAALGDALASAPCRRPAEAAAPGWRLLGRQCRRRVAQRRRLRSFRGGRDASGGGDDSSCGRAVVTALAGANPRRSEQAVCSRWSRRCLAPIPTS
jgi:hypothetical protein